MSRAGKVTIWVILGATAAVLIAGAGFMFASGKYQEKITDVEKDVDLLKPIVHKLQSDVAVLNVTSAHIKETTDKTGKQVEELLLRGKSNDSDSSR